LHTVSTVDLDLVLVILPDDTELDDTLGDGDDAEGGLEFWLLLEEGAVLEGGDQLCEMLERCLVGLRWEAEAEDEEEEEEVGVVSGEVIGGVAGARNTTTYLCRPARTRAQMEGWT
jgi:hypothetical protein